MTRAKKGSVEGEERHPHAPQFVQPVAEKTPRTRVQRNAPQEQPADVGVDAKSNTDPDSVATEDTMTSQKSVDGKSGKKKTYKPKRPKIWTPQKEENLIELIKERVYMYKMDENGYHNRYKKSATITHIATDWGLMVSIFKKFGYRSSD